MTRNYIFILLTVIILSACGKTKQEIELEKAKLELVEKNRNEEEAKIQKIHEQKVSVGRSKKMTELQMQLQKLPEAIEKGQQNIKEIEIFQFGRSSSTKEKQLKEAYNQLKEIRSYGEKLKNEIAQLAYLKTFEFQKTPQGVMNYIFESAKKGDFSNFRYLCDPYAENDLDVNSICLIEMLSDKRKEEIKHEFEKGRIIGEPKISFETAKIEFAFGTSSNKLEIMEFVNRNGLWYLSGF